MEVVRTKRETTANLNIAKKTVQPRQATTQHDTHDIRIVGDFYYFNKSYDKTVNITEKKL